MRAIMINSITIVITILFLLTTACSDIDPITSSTDELITPGSKYKNIDNIKRPFKISSIDDGTGELIEPGAEGSAQRCNDAGLYTLTGSGEGNSTYLGHFTYVTSNCTPFPIPGPLTFTNGIAVLTAANGEDKLFSTYFGQQDEVDENLSATFTIEHQFTGGEGKFKGAIGRVSGTGTINFGTGISVTEGDGYNIFDASNRSFR